MAKESTFLWGMRLQTSGNELSQCPLRFYVSPDGSTTRLLIIFFLLPFLPAVGQNHKSIDLYSIHLLR